MPHKDPTLRRVSDRERFRRRSAERIARGLCPRCGERAARAGAQRLRTLRRQAEQGLACQGREAPGRGHAAPGSEDGARRRAGAPPAADRRTHCSRPVHQVRQGPAGARAPPVRRLHRQAARGRTQPLRRRQGCRQALRRRECRDAPPQCQGSGTPAPQGPARGRPVHPLRQGPACRKRHGVRAVQGNPARCRTGAMDRPARRRLLRQVRGAGRRRQGALHALCRPRGEPATHEKRRQPQPLRPAPGAQPVYRLQRDRPGRRGPVRSLRLALVRPLRPSSRHAGVRAALHRNRTRDRDRPRHLGQLGRSRGLYGLRPADAGRRGGDRRRTDVGGPGWAVSAGRSSSGCRSSECLTGCPETNPAPAQPARRHRSLTAAASAATPRRGTLRTFRPRSTAVALCDISLEVQIAVTSDQVEKRTGDLPVGGGLPGDEAEFEAAPAEPVRDRRACPAIRLPPAASSSRQPASQPAFPPPPGGCRCRRSSRNARRTRGPVRGNPPRTVDRRVFGNVEERPPRGSRRPPRSSLRRSGLLPGRVRPSRHSRSSASCALSPSKPREDSSSDNATSCMRLSSIRHFRIVAPTGRRSGVADGNP